MSYGCVVVVGVVCCFDITQPCLGSTLHYVN